MKANKKFIKRLQGIIDSVFRGNVYPASQVSGGQALHRFLSGEVTPRPKTIAGLAKTFNVPESYLIGETGLPEANANLPEWYFLIQRYNQVRQEKSREGIRKNYSKNKDLANRIEKLSLLKSPKAIEILGLIEGNT